ncbi:protein of unknown function [Bradyrhizobium vignae]|uniref:Uncharacterized protein n=1 Tax=Bradyrhizobium vignae TaxID=1549949 RepID=A0A2U3PQK1_9BRAD|nr:protein of unknown function [Bradyrhizobium vignae]
MSSRHSPKAAVRAARYFVLLVERRSFESVGTTDVKRLAHLRALRSASRVLRLRSEKIETQCQ